MLLAIARTYAPGIILWYFLLLLPWPYPLALSWPCAVLGLMRPLVFCIIPCVLLMLLLDPDRESILLLVYLFRQMLRRMPVGIGTDLGISDPATQL